MRAPSLAIILVLLCASMLAGCDKLTGAADQKSADAEAIGYACRVSGKSPEDCMKENDSYAPSDILYGWKEAADDIKKKDVRDLSVRPFGSDKAPVEDKPTDDKPTAEKPVDSAPGGDKQKDGKAATEKEATH